MISIIIPTLNEEKYLPRLLQSIKEQSFEGDLEIIVADAGSRDKTREIAEKFGCKIVEGGRLPKGRNEGAKAAKGDILLLIDADVVLPKDFLRRALREFSRRGLDGGSFFAYPLNGEFWENLLFDIFYNYPIRITFRFWKHGSMVFLVKKEAHQKINGFDEEIVFLEDLDYVRRLAKKGRYRLMKSTPIFISTRRLQRNDWLKLYLSQNVLGDIYMTLFGPIKKDIFKYKFNHYKNLPR